MTNDEQKDRLVELLEEADKKVQEYILENDHMDWIPKPKELSEVRVDYLLANGVIAPPCKVGDVVWCIVNDIEKVLEGRVRRISVSENFINVYCGVNGYYEQVYTNNEFEEKVFPSKEEAERALATDKNVGSKKEGGAE